MRVSFKVADSAEPRIGPPVGIDVRDLFIFESPVPITTGE